MEKQNVNLTKEHQIVFYIKDYLTENQYQNFLENNGMEIIELGITIHEQQLEMFEQYYDENDPCDNTSDIVNDCILAQEKLLNKIFENNLIVKSLYGLQYFCSCEYPYSNSFDELFNDLFDIEQL